MGSVPRPLRVTGPLALLAALAALLFPAAASAAPVSYENPVTGAKVTLSSDSFRAGEKIEIQGSGFVAISGTTGHPLIAVKPDDSTANWSFGGASAYTGGTSAAPIWFEAADDGSFIGWVEIPADTAAVGPGAGEHANQHWLRVLSGGFSSGDKKAAANSIPAYFTVTPAPAGALSAQSVHQGEAVTVTLSNWLREDGLGGQKVALKIDGGAVLACVQTDAAGNGSGTVTVPADAEPGEHSMRLLAGSACVSGSGTPEPPARSLALPLTVLAVAGSGGGASPGTGSAPAPSDTAATKPKVPSLSKAWISGRKLALKLAGGSGAKVRIVVETARKYRLDEGAKPRILTLAKGATRKRSGVVKLAISKDGRALLRSGAVRAKVELRATGAKARVSRVSLGL